MRKKMLALTIVLVCGSVAVADLVRVGGTNTKYDTTIQRPINGRDVRLKLTGAALRKKLIFNVYTIGSYLQEGVRVNTAEQLAATDAVKQLHMVMQRDISGRDLAEAFRKAVRLNYPGSQFARELETLSDKLKGTSIRRGSHILLTHIPGVGFHAHLGGGKQVLIKNASFSKAVWEIYLGERNIDSSIKKALVSRI